MKRLEGVLAWCRDRRLSWFTSGGRGHSSVGSLGAGNRHWLRCRWNDGQADGTSPGRGHEVDGGPRSSRPAPLVWRWLFGGSDRDGAVAHHPRRVETRWLVDAGYQRGIGIGRSGGRHPQRTDGRHGFLRSRDIAAGSVNASTIDPLDQAGHSGTRRRESSISLAEHMVGRPWRKETRCQPK